MRIAAIDVGTNTIRLLVADWMGGKLFTSLARKELITRLGGGFSAAGAISVIAMERTIQGLLDFKKTIIELRSEKVIAIATSVVRKARNGTQFVQKVREETGIEIVTVSGEAEARLASQGALLPVNEPFDQALIFDIGGGSTEFIFTEGTKLLLTESVDLGVVHLAETHLPHDPPRKKDLAAMENIIHCKIQKVRHRLQDASLYPFKPDARVILIGIAGTPTTLAAIDLQLAEYDRDTVMNHTLSSERIADIFQELIGRDSVARLLLPGLQKGREDLIIPGVLIVRTVMNTLGFSVLRVIDSGILEGLVLSYSSPGASIPCFSKR